MKIWRATSISMYTDGAERFTNALNRIELTGWYIEGTEFYGKDKQHVMIIASKEEIEEPGEIE